MGALSHFQKMPKQLGRECYLLTRYTVLEVDERALIAFAIILPVSL